MADEVATWIRFIDKWTAAANSRHSELPAAQGPATDTGNARDRERKLGELNERFKNL